jgi:hypothetical protein
MVPLTTAFFAAALALLANFIFGAWSRFQERRSIAAALAGEIGAYIKLFRPSETALAFRNLAALEAATRRRRLEFVPRPPTGHPVFDKVADRIGLLPAAEALDVSSTYNVVSGMRILISSLSSADFLPADDQVQIAMLQAIARGIDEHIGPAQDLVGRLKRISEQRFCDFLRRRQP